MFRLGLIAGMLQSEGIEHMMLRIIGQPLTGDPFEDPLERYEVQAAVHEIRPRAEVAPDFRRDIAHRGVRAVLPKTVHQALHAEIGRQPRCVRQEVLDRNFHRFTRFRIRPGLEIRDIPPDRVRQPDLPLLDKLQERERRTHALGQRGQVEDRFRGHGHGVGNDLPVAIGLQIDDPVAADDRKDGAGHVAPGDGRADDGIHPAQFHRIHARAPGSRPAQCTGLLPGAGDQERNDEDQELPHDP